MTVQSDVSDLDRGARLRSGSSSWGTSFSLRQFCSLGLFLWVMQRGTSIAVRKRGGMMGVGLFQFYPRDTYGMEIVFHDEYYIRDVCAENPSAIEFTLYQTSAVIGGVELCYSWFAFTYNFGATRTSATSRRNLSLEFSGSSSWPRFQNSSFPFSRSRPTPIKTVYHCTNETVRWSSQRRQDAQAEKSSLRQSRMKPRTCCICSVGATVSFDIFALYI